MLLQSLVQAQFYDTYGEEGEIYEDVYGLCAYTAEDLELIEQVADVFHMHAAEKITDKHFGGTEYVVLADYWHA
jgi:hypothetical protein